MSTSQLFESITLPTVTNLSAKQYYAVSMDNTGNAVLATATKNCAGFLQNTPDGTTDTAATIGVRGKTRAAITDTIAIAAPLEIASGGTLVNHASGTIVAIANEAGATGDVISVTILTSGALMS
jgi:hypothetical protein